MESVGQICYEGYCKVSGNKSLISGEDLPMWSELKPEIQRAWQGAANAVLGNFVKDDE